MKSGINRFSLFLISATCLILLTIMLGLAAPSLASSAARKDQSEMVVSASEPLIRLRYATFDPLAGEPVIPRQLRMVEKPDAFGTYIVQFEGPVQPYWKDEVSKAGAQFDGYLPDFAFIVRMNAGARAKVNKLEFVRWVGLYHPAYKMAHDLSPNEFDLYRLSLSKWADSAEAKLKLLDMGVAARGEGRTTVVSAQFNQLARIAGLSDVLWIEGFRFFETQNDVADVIMGAPNAWTAGYTGNGQMVTIADTGLDTGVDTPTIGDIHLDFDNRVSQISSWPVVTAAGCINNPGADDGAADVDTGHGTHVAGSVAGNGARSSGLYKGPAYEATLTFQAIEQWTTWTGIGSCTGPARYALTGIPDNLNDLFQEAYDWGSRIHTNSWGSNVSGVYDLSSQQVDQFSWNNKNFTVLFAAGNDGVDGDSDGYVDQDSIGSPATAKNAITIGASENFRATGGFNTNTGCSSYGNCWPADYPTPPTSIDPLSDSAQEMAAFSSRGPTDDGRIKPDLLAPGTNILSTRSSLISGNAWGAGPSQYYMYSGGTSMATPLAAGAVTVVRDYLEDGEGMNDPSSALIKAILINTALDINGYGNSNQEAGRPIPNNHEGWGRIDLTGAISNTNRTLVDDQSLSTGVTHTYLFTATSSAGPLKVSLVWSDYPGSPQSSIQLVNDLNLRLTAPNGAVTYLGNHFSGGWSVAGGAVDTVNNVENVYVQSPAIGTWEIDVIGSNVPQGGQAYALVIDGQGNAGGPPRLGNALYLPVILKSGSAGPKPGYWLSGTSEQFYVTPDQANIDKFSVLVNVTGFSDPSCNGIWRITHSQQEPIVNNQFSFSGSFSANGSFSSESTANGEDRLTNFLIPGCGTISGGPFSYIATWQNSSQPVLAQAAADGAVLTAPFGVQVARKVDLVTPNN